LASTGGPVALVGVTGREVDADQLLTGRRRDWASEAGPHVISEYCAQDQYKVLDGDALMLDRHQPGGGEGPSRRFGALLGCFLFCGDDVSAAWGC